jgi:hypothetical protein
MMMMMMMMPRFGSVGPDLSRKKISFFLTRKLNSFSYANHNRIEQSVRR